MKVRFITLSALSILILGFISFKITHAFFSDTATSQDNTFVAATSFPTPTLAPNQLIKINEVYYRVAVAHRINNSEAASEWAELYNSSSSPVDISGWSVKDNTSCDDFPSGSPIIVPAGGFAILTESTEAEFEAVWTTVPSSAVYVQSPSAIGNGLANNDELILRNGSCLSGSVIDHISWGSNVSAFDPSIPMTPADVSSERNPDGTDTNTNADFIDSNPPTPGT